MIIDSTNENGIYINNFLIRDKNYFSSLVVKGGTITSRSAAIMTQSAGDITILGANLTGGLEKRDNSASIELINTRSLTVSDTIIKGKYMGIFVG